MITIDGSYGEGGGQILRSSLALSLLTRKPFHIENIRARRRKSGLMRQHLTAVNAAAEIGHARVDGNVIGASRFTFEPQTIRPGHYHFAIGTAGSCSLVLQTILPALIMANGPSEVILEGGTHNPFAPPFDFLEKAFLPIVNSMGPKIVAILEKPGFFPAGGGRLRVTVEPVDALQPLTLIERGPIRRRAAYATVSNLPLGIANRELKVVAKNLGWEKGELHAVTVDNAQGPGNVLTLVIESEALTEVFTGFGERGVSAERVAHRASQRAHGYLGAGVPVGPYLADQLLIPMAIAGGGRFRTMQPSRHTLTNIDIIKRFMNLTSDVKANEQNQWDIAFF